MKQELSTIEAARRANVTVRQLNSWRVSGYMHPTRVAMTRNGNAVYRWTLGDVDRFSKMLGLLVASTTARRFVGTPLGRRRKKGTSVVLPEGDYEVVVTWRQRRYRARLSDRGWTNGGRTGL